ncbi:UDP-N-acetylmuramoyl-L-alanyl-D-glutamate--2,6-diaminopimelate ligase [Desulfotruncus alcoholivorax]|uniref:UDP-N-acetylmuramoyl-L-alanyl-D-glutamate--2, 6-diaminopimelate ligase n=1 Tax=Desulfotruncus alcoholivorax TaxID=265477 RepID=UPI000550A256|nr:UDP-N-acetylmuramoyl-L-alanyl-D-glutamate--2,6-diaminopimelate ligase [Desulfotruncus alcoholivorax]
MFNNEKEDCGLLLSDLFSGLPANVPADANPEVRGIAYDSRQAGPGFLFVAIKGYKTDGHFYVRDAVARGATAVAVQEVVDVPPGIARVMVSNTRQILPVISARYYGYPARKMKLIGVTGTNGKTTTTNLINAVYQEQGLKTGLIGTIHNRIGNRLLAVEHTTPESTDLQRLLDQMSQEGVQALVMEVSSHALALGRVDQCEYDTAVFTNITQDHLDFHGTMEEYLEAKTLLFRGLGVNAQKTGKKHAVINADDPAAEKLINACSVDVLTYGIEQPADVVARDVLVTARGVCFTAEVPGETINLHLKLTGKFNVYNALAAVAACIAGGIPVPVIKRALEGVTGVPGRFELVDRGQDFAVIVDYAHTPDGLQNVLSTAREITSGRLITVFGCGGDRDRTKRPQMGAITARMSDLAVVTSDNPRTEDPMSIIEDILPGIRGITGANYVVIPDRREAIRQAVREAKSGDVVVIAGKGHEDYQIIGARRMHFDDREEAAEALELRGVNP